MKRVLTSSVSGQWMLLCEGSTDTHRCYRLNFYPEWEERRGPRSCPTRLNIQFPWPTQSFPWGIFGPLKDTAEGSLPLKCQSFSHGWLSAIPRTTAHQAPLSMDSSGTNTGVGCHSLLLPSSLSPTSDVYWRKFEASLPAVCCVWTPSTWGRGPSVPSSSKAKIGFKGISGFSLLVTSSLDGLDPMGKFIISSNFSFWTDIPFSLGCFSKLGVLGSWKNQN